MIGEKFSSDSPTDGIPNTEQKGTETISMCFFRNMLLIVLGSYYWLKLRA